MKTLRFFGVLLVAHSFFVTAFANPSLSGFVTSQDLVRNDSPSNIRLRNNSGSPTTVYGLYVRAVDDVTPGDACPSSPSFIYSGNITTGAFVTPVTIGAGKSVAIGKNYLYNMIYGAAYYGLITPDDTLPCALPGCTWGTDSTTYNWCIYLGALGPVTTSSGYTSTVPPDADLASSVGLYDYNAIHDGNYTVLGPIACDDQTMTCSVTTQQTQSFP